MTGVASEREQRRPLHPGGGGPFLLVSAANLEKRGEGDPLAATSHSSVVSLAAARIVAKTPVRFASRRCSRNERTRNPLRLSSASRTLVAAIFRMLAAVDFDNQLVLVADEVGGRPAVGACRRNFSPPRRPSPSFDHIRRSALVAFLRMTSASPRSLSSTAWRISPLPASSSL